MSYQLLMAHFKNPSGLAQALTVQGVSISPQAIYKWQRQGIPVDRAPLIEAASNGVLRCEEVCPGVEWTRDKRGSVTGYNVPVNSTTKQKRKVA
ncbi:Cro/CI family transcriptional regulator [Luteibacter sp. NPDC031894]|uniref:Cro/CI family transcriptional regulator n=1 Tax=Luteibacter sp. NPDC031894 TaxID=3390572 RepID=UPI003D09429A